MSPISSGKKKHSESGIARFLGSATSGILELLIFHPVDTVAKRLMTNQEKIRNISTLDKVIFKDKVSSPALRKYMSLFPGLGFAAGYKVSQRIYKYGGQPYVNDFLVNNYKNIFIRYFGEKQGKTMMAATAGSLVGIGEIFLLPLDVLKIKSQTNPEAFRGRGIFRIITEEGIGGLYRGAGWTAARNAPGSFALFGGSALVKESIFSLTDHSKATFFQNFCASIGGAVASITVAAPLDVIKTRIQNRNFESPESGLSIIKNIVRKEGLSAFFKGLTPKILVVGPKLVFSFTVAQSLIPIFHKTLTPDKVSPITA